MKTLDTKPKTAFKRVMSPILVGSLTCGNTRTTGQSPFFVLIISRPFPSHPILSRYGRGMESHDRRYLHPSVSYPVVVVDDGSTDDTAEAASEFW